MNVHLSQAEVLMTVMMQPHPQSVENLHAFSLNVCTLTSLQTLFERVVDNGFHQGCHAIRRDQVCISHKVDVI